RDVAQPGSAPAWGAGGRRFKSGHPDQKSICPDRPGPRVWGFFFPMPEPLILVTNDDGVHAPGIRALALALRDLGQVHVVAPDREVSACAQSLTLTKPLRAETIEPYLHSVDGTPADCVNLALVKLLPRRPDLVVSGINRGANMGEDVFYSGTVGGAREGTFFGVPSIAMSLAVREAKDLDFAPAAAFAAKLAALVLGK